MNPHSGPRARAAVTLVLAAALASVTASGTIASARDDAANCVYYEVPYKQEVPVSDGSGGTQCVPAVAAAQAEAAGWPNFDPTDMTQEIAQYEARQEAAGWPNFDPTDMTQEIAQYEAQQEAAAWPNFDSTAIDSTTSVASTGNGPRMTQIAAETSSAQGDQAAFEVPFPYAAGQVIS